MASIFKVVPFVASVVNGQDNTGTAAKQLADLINQQSQVGWQYVRLENVEINVHHPGNAGCLNLGCWGVVPPRDQHIRYDMVVFRQDP